MGFSNRITESAIHYITWVELSDSVRQTASLVCCYVTEKSKLNNIPLSCQKKIRPMTIMQHIPVVFGSLLKDYCHLVMIKHVIILGLGLGGYSGRLLS